MRDRIRFCLPSALVLLLSILLGLIRPTTVAAQSPWEEILPAPIRTQGLATFGDSLIASCDGVLLVAGGDGRNWRMLGSGAAIGTTFAFDGTRLYIAAGDEGLFVRDPGDEDFHLLNADVPPVWGLHLADDTLLLCTRDTLYASADHGRSFTALSGGSDRSLLFDDGVSLYALFNYDSLYRSDDGGRTWTPCASPYFYKPGDRDTYVLHRGALYAATPDVRGLSRSTDQGRSWRQLPDLPVGDPYRFHDPGVTALAATDEQLLICTITGVHRSTDGGVSWETLSTASSRFSRLFIAPDGLLAQSSGGLFRYDENRRAWRQIVFSHWSRYGTSLIAAGRYLLGSSSRISPDEGESWWAEEHPSAIAAQPDGTLLRSHAGTRDSSWLERSTDDGQRWIFLDSIPPVTYDLAANASRLLIGTLRWLPIGYIWTLRTSSDEAATWSEVLTLPVALTAPRALTTNRRGDILFFSLPHAVFSPDGGNRWDTLRTPMRDSLLAAALTENGLFVQSASGIWKRQDDGSMADTRLLERLPGGRIVGRWREYLCLTDADSLYFVHDITGALRGVPLPDLVAGLSYPPHFGASTSCVYLTTGLATVFRLRLQGILDAEPSVALPDGPTILALHPQPVRDHGAVRVTTVNSGYADIDILDMLGRVRARVHRGFLEAGTHDMHIDVHGLGAGPYLLRLRSGTEIRFHRMIVGG